MFVLVEMVDTVRIPPWDFHKQLNEAIAEELNKKLANKVLVRYKYQSCANVSLRGTVWIYIKVVTLKERKKKYSWY